MRDLNTDPLRSWHKLNLLSFWNSVTSKRRALHSRELTCMYWVANFFNLWKPTILASFLYPTWCMMKLNSKRPVWNVADNELISCKKICDWWKHNKLSLNMSLFFCLLSLTFTWFKCWSWCQIKTIINAIDIQLILAIWTSPPILHFWPEIKRLRPRGLAPSPLFWVKEKRIAEG